MTDKGRRFWGSLGFKFVPKKEEIIYGSPQNYWDTKAHWVFPNGKKRLHCPDINSLDDLMKYGWDKAIDAICHKKNWGEFTARLWLMNTWKNRWAGDKTPAQALYEALCKALEVTDE
jgi:hypothetical protein